MESLAENRDPRDYGTVIDEMFFLFVRSEQYVSYNEASRNDFVDKIEELKMFIEAQSPAEKSEV